MDMGLRSIDLNKITHFYRGRNPRKNSRMSIVEHKDMIILVGGYRDYMLKKDKKGHFAIETFFNMTDAEFINYFFMQVS